MSTYSSISTPIPKDWQAFERQSRILFECILGDLNTSTNGRPGQRQNGVDIFGRRGGTGTLVGVQCKGKDGNYGEPVTESELRHEVEETAGFKPPLDEFILITTVRDDQKIQEAARLLEQELRNVGRQMSVAIWGWGTLEQRIAEHSRAIKAFAPDATPFTDQIIEGQQITIEILQRQGETLDQVVAKFNQRTVVSTEGQAGSDAVDRLLHDQIDQYRTLLQNGKARTALTLLEGLEKQVGSTASNRIRFRILSNIGVAHHRLGNYARVSELFLQAFSYDADNPVAISNKIAGLLMKGANAEAHAEAVSASLRLPDSLEVAIQRIQARREGESAAQLRDSLSASVRFRADLALVTIVAMRIDNDPNWREEANCAAAAHPDDDRFSRIAAEAFLEQLVERDPALLGFPSDKPFDTDKLQTVATMLRHAWDESLSREEEPDVAAAHNAAVVYHILRQKTEATQLADAVISKGVAFDETKKIRIRFYVEAGQREEAINLTKSLKSEVDRDLGLALLQLDTDSLNSRQLAEGIEAKVNDDKHRFTAAEIIVDSYINEGNWDAACAKLDQLSARFSDHPTIPLLKHRVLSARGDSSAAKESLLEARNRLKANTDSVTRYLVAQALERAGLHDEAATVLDGNVALDRDTSGLRLFLTAAYNADRRATVASTFARLPKAIVEREFFQRLKVAFALRCGDALDAESTIRRYLAIQPRDLEMHLQLLRILVGRDDKNSLRAELKRPISDFEGDAEHWMELALFLDTYGEWGRAHSLAYTTWLKNQANPAVNFRYVALFLRPGHSNETPIALDTVTPNAAFGIHGKAQNEKQKFVVEPDSTLRNEPYTIAPDHPIARSALGRRVGDQIDVGQLGHYKIEWIKPKEIWALHHVMETFNLFFPDARDLQRVRIETEGPNAFKPIADGAKARHDAIARAFELYEKRRLPIAAVAAGLGSDPVDTLLALVESGKSIHVCVGTSPERLMARQAIDKKRAQGCVVDAITLHLIRRIGIEDTIKTVCGPIGVVELTVQRLREKHFHLSARVEEPDLSISWKDGELYKTEIGVEQKKAALKIIQEDLDWIRDNANILPARGLTDAPQELRRTLQKFEPGFADDLLAAQAYDRLMVSEDISYRAIGTELFTLRTTWLQPILMAALESGAIDRKRYNQATITMIQYRARFISIDKDLLLGTLLDASGLILPDGFRSAADTLGGPDADMRSHITVALGAIAELWNEDHPPNLLAMAATGFLIERLVRNQSIDVGGLMQILVRHARQSITAERWFLEYLESWLIGHFLTDVALHHGG